MRDRPGGIVKREKAKISVAGSWPKFKSDISDCLIVAAISS